MPTTYAIPNGRTAFDVTLWTGDAVTPKTVYSNLQFQPDMVWAKTRSVATQHALYDSTRGAGSGKILIPNTTDPQGGTGGSTSDAQYGYLSAFNSNGISTVTGSSGINYFFNASGVTYVGWNWKANGGTTASNTSGTITSTTQVNAAAGFSIVTYTGTGSAGTVGHGLGVAPQFIISKNRSAAENWRVAHIGLTNMASWHCNLDTTQAQSNSGAAVWNNTTPTSTIFGVGTDTSVSGNGNGIVAYCWAPVAGFSQFGRYTGNGSADGPFVYTGFRPKWIMIKRTDDTYSWWINDSARDPYNVVGQDLAANLSQAESSDAPVQDFLSNGFKLRTSAYPGFNANGGTYIYVAFAENPFKYANAR